MKTKVKVARNVRRDGRVDFHIGVITGLIREVSIKIGRVIEERELAERFRRQDDLGAARELVLSHLRFVVHIARGYSGYGLPIGDLIHPNLPRVREIGGGAGAK